jgi:hypothetical protein
MPPVVRHRCDEAPRHYGESIWQKSNEMYQGRQTGHREQIVSISWSPHGIPMVIFLYGHLKKHVYEVYP